MAISRKAFLAEPIYHRTASAHNVLVDLGRIHQVDKSAERQIRVFSCLFSVGLLAFCLGSLPLTIMLGSPWFLFLFGGLAFVILTWFNSQSTLLDMKDDRYRLVWGLLWLIRTDMASDSPVEVQLDLDMVTATRKQSRPTEFPPGRYSVSYYRDPWLLLRGQLQDGTKFQLRVTDQTVVRYHHKGKKAKWSTTTTLSLQLRPKAKRYGRHMDLAPGAEQAIQLPVGATLKKIELKPDRLALSVKVKAKTLNGAPVIPVVDLGGCANAMFLGLYQVLNLARRRASRSAAE